VTLLCHLFAVGTTGHGVANNSSPKSVISLRPERNSGAGLASGRHNDRGRSAGVIIAGMVTYAVLSD
jgi:hypothetical protein